MMAKSMKYGYTCSVMFLLSILLHNYKLEASRKLSTRLVYEGRPVRLRCNCTRETMTWKYFNNSHQAQEMYVYRDEQVIDGLRCRFIVDNNVDKSVSFLKTKNVSAMDTGYYKCYCNGDKLVSETLLQVVRKGYPNCRVLSKNDNSTVEYGKSGQKVILACDSGFDSNFPRIRWMREKEQLPAASFRNTKVALKTVKLTKSDQDLSYTCILGKGNATSSPSCSVIPFRYRPKVKIKPSSPIQNVGENVAFKCTVNMEKKRLRLSDIIYSWNDITLDQFSGRFVLGNENRSLQLLDLRDSDDFTKLFCRVTIRLTHAQGKARAVLRVSKTTSTPQEEPKTSSSIYLTSVIQTHSILVTFDTSPTAVGIIAVTLESFYSYIWIPLTSVGLTIVIVILGVLTLNKRRIIKRNENTRRILSVQYEDIKPKAAGKPNDQLVFGTAETVKVNNSSDFEEVPEHELNNLASPSAEIIDSPEHPHSQGERHGYATANVIVEINEFIKPDNHYAQADETKFTEIALPLVGEPNFGSATVGERTIDTFPVYATVNKKKKLK